MCEFPSWFEKDGEVIFLCDKTVEGAELDFDSDIVGHHAIREVYPNVDFRAYKQKEGFPCHKEIAKAIRNGEMRQMMKSARVLLSVNKNGELDGKCEYHDNGKRTGKETYKNGKLEGQYEWYNENGKLMAKGTYKNGKLMAKETYRNGVLQ